MSDHRKPCIDCNRSIDATAKACPFCSWDQSAPPRPKAPAPSVDAATPSARPVSQAPSSTPFFLRRPLLGGVALVAILVIVFVVGSLVHGRDPVPEPAATSTIHASRDVAPPQHSDIDLVPAENSTAGGQQPITSVPVTSNDGSMANPYARDDATALPQSDYAQLAHRAQTQQADNAPQIVDPRSITGRVDGGGAPAPRRTPRAIQAASQARTEPVAVYQPVPSIHVGRDATARLFLTVGSDGRVKDIDIARALPGETARLIGAVQEWRFRPATENGVPIASRFSVDITFHGND
jgi:hypothetical protein